MTGLESLSKDSPGWTWRASVVLLRMWYLPPEVIVISRMVGKTIWVMELIYLWRGSLVRKIQEVVSAAYIIWSIYDPHKSRKNEISEQYSFQICEAWRARKLQNPGEAAAQLRRNYLIFFKIERIKIDMVEATWPTALVSCLIITSELCYCWSFFIDLIQTRDQRSNVGIRAVHDGGLHSSEMFLFSVCLIFNDPIITPQQMTNKLPLRTLRPNGWRVYSQQSVVLELLCWFIPFTWSGRIHHASWLLTPISVRVMGLVLTIW